MKILLLAVLILTLVLGGCAPTIETPVIKEPTTPVPVIPAATTQVLSESEKETEARLVDNNWTSPAEVKIGNYYPGAVAEWKIKIHNGNDIYSKFLIAYSIPIKTREGYSMPPEGVADWVIIADSTPMLAPKETREVLVSLAIPKGIVVEEKQWEFQVLVLELGQGNIQTQTATRWLVTMR